MTSTAHRKIYYFFLHNELQTHRAQPNSANFQHLMGHVNLLKKYSNGNTF